MFDVPVADLGDVYQAVLVHPDVDERAEIDHVAHGSHQLHAGLEVLHAQHVRAQQGRRQLVTRVAPGTQQLRDDVPQGRDAGVQLLGKRLLAGLCHLVPQAVQPSRAHILQREATALQEGLRHRIALRVHGGIVQHVFALAHAQEARALLKRLGAELRHLLELRPALECAVLLAVLHNVLRYGGRYAGNLFQQGRGRRVQVHAHGVHAVLHHAGERLV